MNYSATCVPDTTACFFNELLDAVEISGMCILMHLCITLAFLSFSGPPNFGLS